MAVFVLDGRTMQDHYWGIGRYTFNLARAMGQIAPNHSFRVLYNPKAVNHRFNLADLARFGNLTLTETPAAIFSGQEQMLAFQRTFLADASIYHAPYYALPYLLRVPTVVTLHDVTPLVIPSEMPDPARRILYRTLAQLAAFRARHLITDSDAARADILHHLGISPDKLSVIPLAPFSKSAPASLSAIERMRAALGLPTRYLLYLGINKPHKNLVRLIQAFAQVQTDVLLVIAGYWDDRFPEALEYVTTNNLRTRVLFRHNVAEQYIAPLLCGATAFAFPSLHEGFGLPPLEALDFGIPVVCSNTSALPEIVGDAAILFDPLSVESIAGALSQILSDAALRADLQRRGPAQASKFSWERTARETLQVYEGTAR